jgi:hypothetical protein
MPSSELAVVSQRSHPMAKQVEDLHGYAPHLPLGIW